MTTQDPKPYPEETQHLESGYYDKLRSSTDELHALGVQVVPSINAVIPSDEFTGLDEFEDWRRSGCSDIDDPEQFGRDGTQICGRWDTHHSFYWGHFPVKISMDGSYRLVGRHNFLHSSTEDVNQQIDIAEEYSIPLGISANTMTNKNILGIGGESPNSIIYADADLLENLAGAGNTRIETDGDYTWSYAHINFQSVDIKEYFNRVSGKDFSLTGSTNIYGGIERNGIRPAYPSHVLGKQIQLISPSKDSKIIVISSALSAGIHFDVEDEDTWDEAGDKSNEEEGIDQDEKEQNNRECTLGWANDTHEDENPAWIHTPDEDEALFQQSVNDFTASLKPKPPIKRPKSIDTSNNNTHAIHESANSDESLSDVLDINLFDYLPQKLANALQVIREPLPYDARTVLVSFMTGAASMLRLGTTVTGNELSQYTVPINCYTILVAKSGRKKTPLQKFYVREPASDVLLQVAQQNERMVKTWKEECRGKKNNDRPPRPVAVDIRINDYTGEAFVQALGKLDEVGRAVLIERDEIAALFATLNSYRAGKGSDEQQLLELYDGDGYRSLRVGDTGRAYSRASVSIYGAIQPEVLEKLLKDGDANGMWARFSFTALPDMIKKLPIESSPEQLMELAAAKKYLKDFISRIYELPAIEYKLDEEAMELFSEYEHKKQKDALATKVSAQAAMYGKSAGKVLRHAGLLHIIDFVGNDAMPEHSIPMSRLQDAIQLIDDQDSWTLDCHAKIAGTSNTSFSQFERRVQEIALKESVAVGWSTIRNKMSSKEKLNKTIADAEKATNKFVALGIGKVTNGPNGGLMYRALKPLPN